MTKNDLESDSHYNNNLSCTTNNNRKNQMERYERDIQIINSTTCTTGVGACGIKNKYLRYTYNTT